MSSRCNEVEQRVNSIVSKPWVTLDTRLLGENVIVLSLKITNYLAKALCHERHSNVRRRRSQVPCFIVDLITEAWSIDNRERYPGALLVKFQF